MTALLGDQCLGSICFGGNRKWGENIPPTVSYFLRCRRSRRHDFLAPKNPDDDVATSLSFRLRSVFVALVSTLCNVCEKMIKCGRHRPINIPCSTKAAA